uniref:Thymidine kinase n=1 Tax=Otarine gammaherpesvirus 4 TaxID=2801541 RepID=A0A889IW56_9GAMA|nr:Thymidine kinase [Otarine gammaherpesvirus 4]
MISLSFAYTFHVLCRYVFLRSTMGDQSIDRNEHQHSSSSSESDGHMRHSTVNRRHVQNSHRTLDDPRFGLPHRTERSLVKTNQQHCLFGSCERLVRDRNLPSANTVQRLEQISCGQQSNRNGGVNCERLYSRAVVAAEAPVITADESGINSDDTSTNYVETIGDPSDCDYGCSNENATGAGVHAMSRAASNTSYVPFDSAVKASGAIATKEFMERDAANKQQSTCSDSEAQYSTSTCGWTLRGTVMRDATWNLGRSIATTLKIDKHGFCGDRSHVPQTEPCVATVPCGLLDSPPLPRHRRACVLYLEGGIGVGKTAMIMHLCRSADSNTVLTFEEPIEFWTSVYSNVMVRMSTTSRHLRGNDPVKSAVAVSCQLKFAAPLIAISRYVNGVRQLGERAYGIAPLDAWVLHDRHPLSPLIAFPLVLLKRGILNAEDFVNLLSMFEAHEGDNVVLIMLDVDENLRRIHRRGRRDEKTINRDYVTDVSNAFEAVYYAWLLLRHFDPRDVIRVCVGTLCMDELCVEREHSIGASVAQLLFDRSLFATLAGVIAPVNRNAMLVQICLQFARELAKLQIIRLNGDQYHNNLTAAWAHIYRQIMCTAAIKTHYVDWAALSAATCELGYGD